MGLWVQKNQKDTMHYRDTVPTPWGILVLISDGNNLKKRSMEQHGFRKGKGAERFSRPVISMPNPGRSDSTTQSLHCWPFGQFLPAFRTGTYEP